MGEVLLIDGYNVLNSWKIYSKLRAKNLEHARESFLAHMSEYGAFKGYETIVVFDAQKSPEPGSNSKVQGIEVVYTEYGETADSWIERRAYELCRQRRKVFVVTSDYAEQLNVLGAGAYRISAREFYEEYKQARQDISERLRVPARAIDRNELGGRLQGHVLEYLEQLRRQR